MAIKTVLFDLDGTLLPMDQEVFVRAYFGGISRRLAQSGYEPNRLIQTIWGGTGAMVRNDGSQTNEKAFWDFFRKEYGEAADRDRALFDAFYEEDFDGIRSVCGFDPRSRAILDLLHAKDIPAVLATNPIFPDAATSRRIRWAGLERSDFVFYTTYENASFCKPNLDYYREILSRLGLNASDCLMVGNDVAEDMVARELGMQVFLLTDCLIHRPNTDIRAFLHGTADDLLSYLHSVL